MFEWLQGLYQHPDFWRYLSIPFISGLVGFGTNWVAVKLIFHPLEFVGIPPWLGWQGIIPSKARKMANILMSNTLEQIGNLNEMFQAMEPEKVAEQVMKSIDPLIEDIVDEVVEHSHDIAWANVPESVKQLVYKRVRQQLPGKLNEIIQEVEGNIENYVDPIELATTILVNDKRFLNETFQRCGADEFRFVIKSGFYFGFAFGVVQMLVWILYPQWWVLPLFGVLVGYATNWIALNVIFRPLNPVKILGITIHGLFLKRQKEVSRVFSEIATENIFTIRNVVDFMLNGSRSRATHELIYRITVPAVDDAAGVAKLPLRVALGDDYSKIQFSVANKVVDVATMPFEDEAFNRDRAKQLDKLIVTRMEAMSPSSFQDMLRPAFQEDEWKMIIIGALLGGAVGTGQLFLLFGHKMVETVVEHAPQILEKAPQLQQLLNQVQ